jgi:hypothetical protein
MIGDSQWYTSESTKRGLPTFRCPFANVERCPRYFESLSLLGKAGSTRIDEREDRRLLKNWRKSELWPKIAEQASATFGPSGRDPHLFTNFCPEVLFDRFGWFACSLAAYSDEVDRDFAHAALGREGTSAQDWRWAWPR